MTDTPSPEPEIEEWTHLFRPQQTDEEFIAENRAMVARYSPGAESPFKVGMAARFLRLLDAAEQRTAAAGEEAAALQRIFDLRWNADMRAMKRWREAGPDRDHIMPDRSDMVVFLLTELSAAEDKARRTTIEECELAVRTCGSLDEDGHVLERQMAIRAIRALVAKSID